jgi:hypothetical protein
MSFRVIARSFSQNISRASRVTRTRGIDSATAAVALYAIYIPLLNYNRAPGLPSRGIAD